MMKYIRGKFLIKINRKLQIMRSCFLKDMLKFEGVLRDTLKLNYLIDETESKFYQ
jgi:hypothetical protein